MKASSSTGSSMATPVSRPTDVGSARVSVKVPSGVHARKSSVRNVTKKKRGIRGAPPPGIPPKPRSTVLGAHGDASGSQVFLRLRYGILAEVEDRGGQDGAGAAFGQALVEVLQGADPAAGDDRDGHGLAHRPEEFAVVA